MILGSRCVSFPFHSRERRGSATRVRPVQRADRRRLFAPQPPPAPPRPLGPAPPSPNEEAPHPLFLRSAEKRIPLLPLRETTTTKRRKRRGRKRSVVEGKRRRSVGVEGGDRAKGQRREKRRKTRLSSSRSSGKVTNDGKTRRKSESRPKT